MFADDLLLFGEASEKHILNVMNTLRNFCEISGQEASMEKSSILFSVNVARVVRNKIVQIFGFKENLDFGSSFEWQNFKEDIFPLHYGTSGFEACRMENLISFVCGACYLG